MSSVCLLPVILPIWHTQESPVKVVSLMCCIYRGVLYFGAYASGCETLMAALLHDVIEDTEYTKDDVAERFGRTVSDLVDGVTKLTHSSDKQFNKAASFRKILQATLQDPRVIIIKLADRYS
jgi:(p)ppGpp synthase/HD superfamily hydrolase